MDDGERQAGRHAFGDHPQRDTGRSVQEPVTPTLEDREAGLVCARHSRALRHAVVPSVGIRPPARGAGDAPALPDNGSGRSVLVVALFHSAYNSAWGTGEHKFTGELISGPAATLIPIGVVAVVVAAFTKGRLSYEPERVPQRAATARS
jgi:hypothetical protein